MSNLQEFLDGTNPTNASSVLRELTVFSDGGLVTVVPEGYKYTNGTQVTLTATALSPDTFHGWTGDATSHSSTITLTVTTNLTVFAHFTPINTTWTNTLTGDWNAATNWDPNLVPGTNDNVRILNAATVVLAATNECFNFTLGTANSGGPTLTGGGTLTVHGTGLWNAGLMTGGGRTVIDAGASLNLAGAANLFLSGRILENAGTIFWSGAGSINAVGSVITNRAGALFDAQNAASFYLVSGARPASTTPALSESPAPGPRVSEPASRLTTIMPWRF